MWRIAVYWFERATVWNPTVFDRFLFKAQYAIVRDESNGNNLVGSLEMTSCKPFCSDKGYASTALTQTLPIIHSL